MQFEHPQYLWFLPLAAALLATFFWWAWRAKRRLVTQFVAARLVTSLTVGVSPGRQKARLALLAAAVLLSLGALARPQLGFSWEEARSRGLDIVVAIDTSRSMLATDIAPNRLQRAKLEALNLKRLARADRLGLVAFAGSAFLQSPLTLDDEAFRQSVELLDVNIIPQGGTALAEAIAAAKSAFKEGNENHKVLVLFTDGEDHDGTALEAAKQGAKDGLRIFTVGVGTPSGEMLRTTDVQGRTEFIKDTEGNAVKSRLDESLLRSLAQETGGFYVPLSGASTMNLLYERGLAPLPKSELASQKIKRHHERYQWLLGLVLVLLFVEMLLPERAPTKDPATAALAPAGGARTAAISVLLALLAWPTLASASSSKALKQYTGGKYDAALLEYERALKKRPDDPRLHYNAGAAAFQARDYDQALSHLNAALVTPDLKLQEQAYYNLGNTQFRLGEDAREPDKKKGFWRQAAKGFESALKLEPTDADAAFNLELVKKKLQELEQQQQDQKQDKDQQKSDDKQDQSSKDQQSEDQQKQDQQKQEQQKQEQEKKEQQKKEQSKPDDQQPQPQQDSAKQEQKDKQNGEKKEGQQASESKDKPEDPGDPEAQPQGATTIRMTPQQAMQLLDTLKAEEKTMPFRPILKTNRQDRVFKDW